MSILRAEGVSVRYGGVRALSDVDLKVEPGQLVGLIGPNGAGKTTFVDAITGFAPATGRIWLGDRDISSLRPHQRAGAGMARTFQSTELFVDLTVRENVAVPHRRTARSVGRELLTGRPRPDREADEVLDVLGIGPLADVMPETLTQGQRKLVGVARALAQAPQLVCLDEPAAGLDTSESGQLGRQLRRLADAGQSLLLVDHDMGLVLSVCDEIVVLNFGRVIARGGPGTIRKDPQVRAAYLGGGTDPGRGTDKPAERAAGPEEDQSQPARPGAESPALSVTPRTPRSPDPAPAGSAVSGGPPPVLVMERLRAGYNGSAVIRDLDLVVHPGEVVALLGPNGAGKTTTLRAASRLIDPLAGCVRYRGEDIARIPAHLLPRRGLVQVPEDRGVFSGLTVAEHFRGAPGSLDPAVGFDYFPALRPLRDRRAGLLSGGEQQMLALALALARKPRLLLLDELSHGLAPVIVQELLPIVCAYAAEAQAGILLVEQQVPLALRMSDRAYVLVHGELIASGRSAQLRQDEKLLMAGYLGESTIEQRAQRDA